MPHDPSPLSASRVSEGAAASRIETGFATHPGMVREENEDSCLVAPDIGVFAVADGMGGHDDGALASATVVEALASIGVAVSAADLMARLEDRVVRANATLWSLGQARGGIVGATAAVLLVFGEHFACLWSGDSRIYQVRAGAILRLTRDHTEGRDLFERGLLTADEMATWPRRHVITRALGVASVPELDLEQGVLSPGDVLVICSDGLSNHVTDAEILQAASCSAPQPACDALLALTLARGASDNVTVVIVRCGPHGGGEPVDTLATVALPGSAVPGGST